MSTLGYAALTTRRSRHPAVSIAAPEKGVGAYVDALAALVPAEVLALHAVILSVTTKSVPATATGPASTTITEPTTLFWAFYGLLAVSVLLYVVPRVAAGRWDNRLDFARAAIPPAAFVAWTMLQRSTAFDVVCPGLAHAPRTVVALFAAVVLGVAAAVLAYRTKPDAVSQPARTSDPELT